MSRNTHLLRGADRRALRVLCLRRDDYKCQKCARRGKKLEMDHIVPLEDGGEHCLDNVQMLCVDCHIAKTRAENTEDPVPGQDEWEKFARASRFEKGRPK